MINEGSKNFYLPESISRIAEQLARKADKLHLDGDQTKASSYYSAAALTWEKICERRPESEIAADMLCCAGDNYNKSGQYQKAVSAYQKILTLNAQYDKTGSVLLKIGRNYETMAAAGTLSKTDAIVAQKAVYEQIITDYPDTQPAKYAQEWLSKNN